MVRSDSSDTKRLLACLSEPHVALRASTMADQTGINPLRTIKLLLQAVDAGRAYLARYQGETRYSFSATAAIRAVLLAHHVDPGWFLSLPEEQRPARLVVKPNAGTLRLV